MASVNISSIMGKVKSYSASKEGKRRMSNVIDEYISSGKDVTAGGSKLISDKSMNEAAEKLRSILLSTAQSSGLPMSVLKHIEGLQCSNVVRHSDGTCEMFIYFGGDLHRDSLYADGYDGVDNIVAVLNNGYHARDYVYGDWDTHSPTGESVFDGRSIDSSAYIRSRKDREGLHFIQQAVADFNGNYGADYNVTAKPGDAYT